MSSLGKDECKYYATIAATTDLVAARPGAADGDVRYPYKFEVRGTGNLELRFRHAAAGPAMTTTDTVITGIIAPDVVYFEGATHIVVTNTTATKITVYWR
uniref:Uncharacterized protein n=1 Tax=viral metagenome TaxID=1070528 RepID=A0A6M3XFD0_9ZZZZ